MNFLKGIHYRSRIFYDALDLLKLGRKRFFRFQIAAQHIKPGESVIDVCAGCGALKDFILRDCAYTAVEASPEFSLTLKQKGIECISCDLHRGWPESIPTADVIVMVISLCQFRDTSAERLLESFKKAAKRVVIVEEVLKKPRLKGSWFQKLINYLCATDFYVPVDSWYTGSEFEKLMQNHGYQCEKTSGRYRVGSYGFNPGQDKVS
ncbi:MAG TPA: class I SAM-dependent methyltransferase [Candidatus Omnitrophota bacterium]|nr:class I SAM-dependent methyltransferase [Candidatus Omnitrophota bacterium]